MKINQIEQGVLNDIVGTSGLHRCFLSSVEIQAAENLVINGFATRWVDSMNKNSVLYFPKMK